MEVVEGRGLPWCKKRSRGIRQNASRLNLHLDEVTRQLVQGDDQAREKASVGQRLMKPCRHCHGGPASGVWLTPPYHWKDPEPGLCKPWSKLLIWTMVMVPLTGVISMINYQGSLLPGGGPSQQPLVKGSFDNCTCHIMPSKNSKVSQAS